MRKTTLAIDEALLKRAGKILGTRGIKATIDRALLEVVTIDARRKAIEQLQEMSGLDLDKEEVTTRAWR